MTCIITRLCRDCLDTSYIEVSSVDWIYEYVGPTSDQFPNQLYIDPGECIDCQACEPLCPWEAPLRETEVPPVFDDDIALNASIVDNTDKFRVPAHRQATADYQRLRRQQAQMGMGRLKAT